MIENLELIEGLELIWAIIMGSRLCAFGDGERRRQSSGVVVYSLNTGPHFLDTSGTIPKRFARRDLPITLYPCVLVQLQIPNDSHVWI